MSPAQTKPREIAKNEVQRTKSQHSKTNAPPTFDAEGFEDLKDVGKEIEEAFKESKDESNDYNKVPEELRSNDPRSPVDPIKLKIFVKKQREEALQKVREANRLRIQQGLPPLPQPQPLRKIRRQQLRNSKVNYDN